MSEGQTPNPALQSVPDNMEVLRYKEELAAKMGLPSPFGMNLMKQVANDLVSSGIVPKHFANNPMAVYMAAMRGREMGFDPMESVLETFWAAPGGRLGMYANKMLQKMHKSGVTSKFLREDREGCEILFTPPKPHEPYTAKFYRTEAEEAKLIRSDSNWEKWGADMNKARAIARGWRSLIGTFEGSSNMYIPEELGGSVESEESNPTLDDTRRVDVMNAKGDFTVGLKTKPSEAVVDVKPESPAPAPQPPPMILYDIRVISAENGQVLKVDREKPQEDLETAKLRAQALANEFGLAYLVYSSMTGKIFEAKPPSAKTPPPPAPQPEEPAKGKKQHGPAEKAMADRMSAIVKILDPSPKAVVKTWTSRISAYVAGYLGCGIKDLPKDVAQWDEPITNLEFLLQADVEAFRSGPEQAGKSRRANHEGIAQYSAKTWPNDPTAQALAVKLADKWNQTADPTIGFPRFIEANEYHKLTGPDLESLLRLYMRTREAGRIAKLSRDHNLSIAFIVKEIEENLKAKLEDTPEPVIVKQITRWTENVREYIASLSPKKEEAPPEPPAPEAPTEVPEPDLFWNF